MGEAVRKLESHPATALGWIGLAAFARDVLGTKARGAGRSGRDWCQARGVPYVRDGKHNYARVEDLRRAIERRMPANDGPRAAAVEAALRAMG